MTLLTGETDVFSAASTGQSCVVAFLARRQPGVSGQNERRAIEAVLQELAAEGWLLSVRAMFEGQAGGEATVFDCGFAHAVDMAGVFEAPTLSGAIEGTVRLEKAGWSRLFTTEWLLGQREFATVAGRGEATRRDWGFLAFWEWNDAWAAATPAERQEYDAECDVAFKNDLALDVTIAGRHRLDWASSWHHIGVWEVPSPEIVDEAMLGHEAAADFKFTTSRHFIGRRTPLAQFLAAA